VTFDRKSPNTSRASRMPVLLLATAASIVLLPGMASASAFLDATSIGVGANAAVVSDDALGEMRGRFVDPDAIRFFGIQLASYWETSDGVLMTASIQFQVDFNDKGEPSTPSLLASFLHGCGGCGDESVEIPSPDLAPAGLASVNGAVQSTQISGDYNAVGNQMHVGIGTEYSANNPGFTPSGTPLTDSKTVSFSDGSAIQFTVAPERLALMLQGANDSGVVLQEISGGAGGQVGQYVDIAGDANDIHNAIDLFIGIDQLPSAQLSVETALSSMKGMGF
jgi:hypothetical protein